MSSDEVKLIATVLLDKWDLMGVREVDEMPEQEYLHEAEALVRMLQTGAGVNEVKAYLVGQAAELGGSDAARDALAAEAVLRAWTSHS